MNKQLFRSKTNKMIAGVCGGISEYFQIDPTIIRLIWVVFSLTYGIGLVAYIIAAIVIPEGYQEQETAAYSNNKANYDNSKTNMIIGVVLIVLGVVLVGKHFLPWFDYKLIWSLILIGVGALIIYGGWRKN